MAFRGIPPSGVGGARARARRTWRHVASQLPARRSPDEPTGLNAVDPPSRWLLRSGPRRQRGRARTSREGRAVPLERGVERAVEEQLLVGPVDAPTTRARAVGAGIGGVPPDVDGRAGVGGGSEGV